MPTSFRQFKPPSRALSRVLRPIAWGTLLVSVLVVVGCGGKDRPSYQAMTCATYQQSSDYDRDDIIEAAAKEFGLQMLPPDVGGLYDKVRIVVDEQCRHAQLLYSAMATASHETSVSLPKLLSIRGGRTVTSATPAATAMAEPSAAARIAFKPDRTIVWGAKDSGSRVPQQSTDAWVQRGATATVTVKLARPVKAQPDTVPMSFAALLGACQVDPGIDAAIPMRMTIHNTSSVPLNLAVDGWLEHGAAYSAPGMTVEAASHFADGDACQSGGGVNATNWRWTQDQLAPGALARHDWLLIVHNYYPSDYPDGHEIPLSKALASFNLSATSSDGELVMDETTCYSGPRVAGVNPQTDRPSFSLNGDLSHLGDRPVTDHPEELNAVPEC